MGKGRKRNITEYEKELIEGYFNDTLNPEELNTFVKLSDNDTDFAQMVNQYRQLALYIDSIAEQELLKDLDIDIQQLGEDQTLRGLFEQYPQLQRKYNSILNQQKNK